MRISWPEFETAVDSTILDRGRDYWRHGRVQELSQDDNNHWSALVEGSEVYEVTVKLTDEVADYKCDCPYDLGPVCKHTASVLYAVRETHDPDLTESPENKSTTRSGSQKNSRRPTVKSVTEILAPEELADLITLYAKKDKVFRAYVLSHEPVEDSSSKAQYQRLIRLSLQAGMNRDGFIDYRGGARAVEGADELIDQARHCLRTDPVKASTMCQAILEELIPALQYADDSNGEIGGSIENAAELLEQTPAYIQDRSYRQDLFSYSLSESVHERHQGWDWKWNLLRTAGALVDADPDQAQLFDHLDRIVAVRDDDSFFRRHDLEWVAEIKAAVIRRRQGEAPARKFVNQNLDHPTLRRQALVEAAEAKDTATIKRLAREGLETDKAYPCLVIEWVDWMLRAAELENSTSDIGHYTRELLFPPGDLKYYDTLKRNHDAVGWPAQSAQILKEIQAGKSRANSLNTIVGIYRREQDWQSVYRLLRRHSNLRLLEHYHNELANCGTDALFALYQQTIRAELKAATNRQPYQEICRSLRRLRKSGASSQVVAFVNELKSQYSQRPALIKELDKV